jgi:hypothetical protein
MPFRKDVIEAIHYNVHGKLCNNFWRALTRELESRFHNPNYPYFTIYDLTHYTAANFLHDRVSVQLLKYDLQNPKHRNKTHRLRRRR